MEPYYECRYTLTYAWIFAFADAFGIYGSISSIALLIIITVAHKAFAKDFEEAEKKKPKSPEEMSKETQAKVDEMGDELKKEHEQHKAEMNALQQKIQVALDKLEAAQSGRLGNDEAAPDALSTAPDEEKTATL